jgi:hypothetical protein
MKIFDFFRKYKGKMVRAGGGAEIFDKLEPEPEPEPEPKFLTSWSQSRTKMDRLRNTGQNAEMFKRTIKRTVRTSGRP